MPWRWPSLLPGGCPSESPASLPGGDKGASNGWEKEGKWTLSSVPG